MTTPTRAAALTTAAIAMALSATPGAAQQWYDAKSDGRFMARLRALAVLPNEDLTADRIDGANAKIDDSYVPELDLTYFFTDNIAAELILAVTPHDVSGAGALAGADLGSTLLLPPTLTLQYHFTDLDESLGATEFAGFKPYVGAGINYTFFLDEDAGQFDSIDYDDTFGFALQAGVDYEIAEGVYLNADVKYIFLETDWTLDATSAGLGVQRGDVEINPLIIGVGIGYRF